MATAVRDAQPGVSQDRKGYRFPPGFQRNLLWFAFRKFRPANPIILFQHLAQTYGDIAHYKIGPHHIVFLNNPDYIREVLVVQNDNFIKERTVQRTKMLLGEGMITAEGAAHRSQRLAAQAAFHRQRVGEYGAIIVEEAARVRDSWSAEESRDIAVDMMHLTLNVVARTLFATDLRDEVYELAAAINRIMGLYNFLVMLPAAEWLVHLRPPGLAAFIRARKRIDAVVYRMIDAHRESGRDKGSLLDLMLAASPANDEASRQSLRDQVITIFLAGYETVANALSWTWYLLSENPDCEAKLHEEVDRVLAGRLPVAADVPNLRYTETVMAESLRLYPPAWAMGRYARNDFTLGEYYLPARTTVLISQFITQRDPRYFPDPLRFDPDRFSAQGKARRAKFTYFPFGAGARQCIGESFAWMEGVLILATVAQKWKLHLAPGHRIEPQPLITLRPKYGMLMEVASR
ncbi:MAG TPA: cytochrome P450 [Candidatus Deferrimicrobiaceae bacterium]|jgi:cytochrome P450|nr:cytochrome P450 [Candidatus Deferrimicrobiaceae bacterium]